MVCMSFLKSPSLQTQGCGQERAQACTGVVFGTEMMSAGLSYSIPAAVLRIGLWAVGWVPDLCFSSAAWRGQGRVHHMQGPGAGVDKPAGDAEMSQVVTEVDAWDKAVRALQEGLTPQQVCCALSSVGKVATYGSHLLKYLACWARLRC
jgi:hypothetical protein